MRPVLRHAPSSRQLLGHCNPICEPRPQHKSRAVQQPGAFRLRHANCMRALLPFLDKTCPE
ncbi:hypothetical protein AEQU_0928 [Adlercreutzia equolifaciens DSM 19450]|nr:hypothetical protein AEQU_0928 [Adlercreutzia equolifaciens DSM 19450]